MRAYKRHIVILTPGFPKDENDNNCIPALHIFCRNIQKNAAIKITVLTVHYPYNKSTYQWHSCTVNSLGINNKKRNRILSFYSQWNMLSKIHRREPIDVIHSFWLGESAFIGHHFSKKYNLLHLTTLMGQDAKKGNKYAGILPLKKMNLVSLSQFHKKMVLKNYGIQTHLILWGIEDNNLLHLNKKTIDIIGVGSFIPLKNYSDFIITIQHLKKEFPKIKAVLIGDGKLKLDIITQIKANKLSENILLKGELSYNETQEYLSKSKILLHPSKYESFGMVFAEALAYNTNIVSMKVGFAEANENWYIGTSPKDFAIGCASLLKEKSQSNTFPPTIESTVKAYLKIYLS